jgi:hypothetical protein
VASLGAAPLVLLLAGCFRSLGLPDAAGAAEATQPAPEPPTSKAAAGEEWSPMPKSEEVDELLAQPSPSEDDVFGSVGKAVDHWTLADAPTAAGVDAYAGDNWGAAALTERVGGYGSDARATAGMTCVARQLAEFMGLYGVMPSFGLQEFVLARCGSLVGRGDFRVRRFTIDLGKRKASEPAVRRMIQDALDRRPEPPAGAPADAPTVDAPAPMMYGAWYDGDALGGLLVVAHGTNRLGVEPFPMSAGGRDHVRVAGRKPSGVEAISGYVTAGDGDYLRCSPAPDAPRGTDQFALVCPVRSTDAWALVDLVTLERRRVLASKAMTLFVSPDGSLTSKYATRPFREGERSDATSLRRVVDAINELRTGVGLPELILAASQSEEMAGLLPHYLAASADPARGEQADAVALAFLAGRKVDHVVVDASFLHFTVDAGDAASTGRMLAQQAMSPMARSTLLDAEAQSLAIGIQKNTTSGAIAFVLATYEHPDIEGQVVREAQLYDALNEARGGRSLSRVRQLEDAASRAILDQGMAGLEHGAGPDAQGPIVQQQLDELHRRSFGYSLQGLSDGGVDDVEWPLQLLELDEVQVAIRVGYYRPEGTNWAHELVLVVYTEPSKSREAAPDGAKRRRPLGRF